MENHRVGETGLSESGPSSQPVAYGVHGITPAATNFFDQEGTAYFGELEEALMQGVAGIRSDGDRKPFFTPPTLEIFPSWPMRFQQTPKGNSQPAKSSDSGSAQNTISQLDLESPVSIKASSGLRGQQQGMMASDAPRAGAAAPNHQPKTQDNRRVAGSTAEKDGKILDAKTLRRLAQNREAARKSRLRKKAYIQQLESSRIKLTQLEQDLQRARSQGLFLGAAGAGGNISSAAAVFDMEYSRWLDENCKRMTELREGLQAHLSDGDLRVAVDECLTHYDEIFRLKGVAAKSDVFHLITGTWTTPAERFFLWMGGFRPSELLKILIPQMDPLTEQQLVGICNLQQSSQQAEEALSQGLEQLHQSLADTVASGALSEDTNVGNYMSHIAIALGKLANLEGFVRQADNLRQQTLHQMRRILTVRQAARCFLAIGEYHSRLRALSSLWASHPRGSLITNESACPTTTDLQIIHQPVHSHFSAF
ncbi:transcription factor TGA2.2 [Elaeis guineensis]|uniref:Transcription factor TGA2.2 n=1 Tax=Elaeis guineensis var. tenera TaxID=51953 RepID=A0A6I9QDX7_ELAGV|nr:transcription factor TGA2.2 [Elaeis guineensis]XP_019702357.1 transcription factor TGA2.2 [Elaeis guineensis]